MRLVTDEEDLIPEDEGSMDASCTKEAWAKLRDVYDCNLEETNTYTSPFLTWDIMTGSANTAPKGNSIFGALAGGGGKVGSVGKLKGFFRIMYKPVYCGELLPPQTDGTQTGETHRRWTPCTTIANYLISDNFLECDFYRCALHKPALEAGLDAFRDRYCKEAIIADVAKDDGDEEGRGKNHTDMDEAFFFEGDQAVTNVDGEKWNFRGSEEVSRGKFSLPCAALSVGPHV